MKWVSRDFIHFDRVVTPWLILRFVDPEAEFIFVPWGKEDERPADAIPYALPGVELGPHDAEGTTFDRVMAKYELGDPGLDLMAQVVRNGVNKTLFDIDPPRDRGGGLMEGVMAAIEGLMLSSATDHETIARALPVLDGLYAMFRAEDVARRRGNGPPPTDISEALWRTAFNSAVVVCAREQGRGYDGRTPLVEDELFETRLRAFQHTALHSHPGRQ